MSQNASSPPASGEDDGAGPEPARMRVMLDHLITWFDATKKKALTALVIRIAGAGLAYTMQILLAQWMGLTEYGTFVTVWVWLLVLGGIAPLGLNVSAIGLLSKQHDAGEFGQWRGTLLSCFGMTVAASLMIAGLGWGLLYWKPDLLDAPYLAPIWLCLFCVPLMALSDVNEGVSRAHGWMNTALMPTYLLRPALLMTGGFLAVQSGARLDATLAMGLAIMACLLTVLVQGIVVLVRLRRLDGAGKLQARPGALLIASLPIVVAQAFELITQNFDLIAVAYFLGPESTGIYFAALKTIALLAFVNFAIGAATANHIASLHAADKTQEFREALDNAVNLSFWPTLMGAIVMVALAPWLLTMFGKDFAGHSHLTAVLAVGFVARGFVGPAELYLNVLGQQRICAVILLIAASLNLFLNIALIPVFGLLGAAIATSVSLVVLSIGLFTVMKRRFGIALRPGLPTLAQFRLEAA